MWLRLSLWDQAPLCRALASTHILSFLIPVIQGFCSWVQAVARGFCVLSAWVDRTQDIQVLGSIVGSQETSMYFRHVLF